MTKNEEKKDVGASCGCGSRWNGSGKWIWIILALAIVAVFLAKPPCLCRPPKETNQGAMATPSNNFEAVKTVVLKGVNATPAGQTNALPRLVDLGATKCIPCKMMAPILEDLKKTYAGKLEVQFIDVWENPDAGKKYGINLIPTQIFYDATGKEQFRHEGFFAKEDILTKWKELGTDLK